MRTGKTNQDIIQRTEEFMARRAFGAEVETAIASEARKKTGRGQSRVSQEDDSKINAPQQVEDQHDRNAGEHRGDHQHQARRDLLEDDLGTAQARGEQELQTCADLFPRRWTSRSE